jgi:CheY-like chemotaxis protein
MAQRPQVILLVEDCPDDVFFMRYALKKAAISHPVHVVTDGQQAVDYLSGAGKYSDRREFPLPTVIFLDLKLPFLSGFEVLAWIRSQPALAPLPVHILTGSSEDRDRARARELGVRSYLVKPPREAMLIEAMESLGTQPPLAEAPGAREEFSH